MLCVEVSEFGLFVYFLGGTRRVYEGYRGGVYTVNLDYLEWN